MGALCFAVPDGCRSTLCFAVTGSTSASLKCYELCMIVIVEVADTCLFLASDKSKYITGTSIEVTGGLHM